MEVLGIFGLPGETGSALRGFQRPVEPQSCTFENQAREASSLTPSLYEEVFWAHPRTCAPRGFAPSVGAVANERRFWLMKSEPQTFGIDDLERLGQSPWDGVRNYRARNIMRDEMQVGDLVLFYHSNAKPSGVAGVARVASSAYPDPTQFDSQSSYYDPRSSQQAPRWWLVDVQFVERLRRFLPLALLKSAPELDGMMLIQRGARLSVQPVEEAHFRYILTAGRARTLAR